MKKVFFIFFLIISSCLFGQEIETKFISKFPLKADRFIGIDEFKSVFYIANNVLFKKNKAQTVSYNNATLGELTSVDILNPFKLNLFYKEFNSIQILDNNLNELTNKINFTTETLFNNVLFISQSSENNIWLYADDNKLHLFNFQNRSEKIQTQPITFYQDYFEPVYLKSTYKNVWIISKTGAIQFNEYGNFIQIIDIKDIDYFFPVRKSFIYIKDNSMFYYTDKRSIKIEIDYLEKIENIHINSSSINIYDGEFVYQFELLMSE